MADIYGTLVKAQLESLAADIGSPPNGFIYLNTVSSTQKFYDGAAWRTVVTLDNTQTLTNKTLTAAKVSDFEDFTEVAAPATPGAGFIRVYGKADGKMYKKTSAGVESELGGSGAPVATATVTGTVTSYVPVIQSAVFAAGDAPYTIADADGYSHVTVAPVSTERIIDLPSAANNIGRSITVTNIGTLTTNSSSKVRANGGDIIYNGGGLGSTEVGISKSQNRKKLTALAAGIWLSEEAPSEFVCAFGTSGNFSTFQAYVFRMGNIIFVTVDYATWPSHQQPRTTSSASIPVGLRVGSTTVIGGNTLYSDYNNGNISAGLVALPDGNLEIRLNSASTGIGWALTGFYFLRN